MKDLNSLTGSKELDDLIEKTGCKREIPGWIEAGESWTATHYRTYDLLTTDNEYSRFVKRYLKYRHSNIKDKPVIASADEFNTFSFGRQPWRNLNETYLTEPFLIKRNTLDRMFVNMNFESILNLDKKGWVAYKVTNTKYKHWIESPPSIDDLPNDDDLLLLYLLSVRQKKIRPDAEHPKLFFDRIFTDFSLIQEAKAIKNLSQIGEVSKEAIYA